MKAKRRTSAAAERDREAVLVVGRRVRLVLDGRLVQRVTADGAGVGADIPAPPVNSPWEEVDGKVSESPVEPRRRCLREARISLRALERRALRARARASPTHMQTAFHFLISNRGAVLEASPIATSSADCAGPRE